MVGRATLYLLTGLPCSGKTTYAMQLEADGVIRVSVDDMMIESVGRLGFDYSHSDHIRLLNPVVASAHDRVAQCLAIGSDVVLDHGLGQRSERDELKQLAETHNASWKLMCFDADMVTLRARCQERFKRPGTVPISSAVLAYLATSWDRPAGEGETVVVTG